MNTKPEMAHARYQDMLDRYQGLQHVNLEENTELPADLSQVFVSVQNLNMSAMNVDDVSILHANL